MSARNIKILEAAGQLFARYGVSKTTMNDIARDAGVARQTLYNAYPSKDEVLRAVIRLDIEETHRAVVTAWDEAGGLGEKLDIFFNAGPLKWYDMVQSSPDMAELFDGLHKVAKVELDQAAALWTASFADALAKEGVSEARRDGLADFIYSTSGNAKYNAQDRTVVETRLAMLKASVLALTNGADQPAG